MNNLSKLNGIVNINGFGVLHQREGELYGEDREDQTWVIAVNHDSECLSFRFNNDLSIKDILSTLLYLVDDKCATYYINCAINSLNEKEMEDGREGTDTEREDEDKRKRVDG